jgi:hypothetical protein
LRAAAGDAAAGPRAVAVLEQPCEAGDAPACGVLGTVYLDGRVAPRDLARAAATFARACEASDGEGCAGLGIMNATGAGVARDELLAAGLFKRGCIDGRWDLACAHAAFQLYAGQGLPENPEVGGSMLESVYEREGHPVVGQLEASCARAVARSCTVLGLLYQQVHHDEDGARFLQKGCALADEWACRHGGTIPR